MDLTDAQKTSIASWIKESKSIADVQRLLREEFDISMTYMDVRFLVDDLDITFAEPEPEEEPEDAADKPESGEAADAVEEPEVVDVGGTGSVSVEVDAVMRPGALVSGTVTFSDGEKLSWQLDRAGQLGLIPGVNPDYRPKPEDIEAFQAELETALRKQGF